MAARGLKIADGVWKGALPIPAVLCNPINFC